MSDPGTEELHGQRVTGPAVLLELTRPTFGCALPLPGHVDVKQLALPL